MNSESRCHLSALCCHKLRTTAWSCNHFPGMGPAKGRSEVRHSLGVTALDHAMGVPKIWNFETQEPEIKHLGHRQGEQRVQTKTDDTRGVIDCFSVSAP